MENLKQQTIAYEIALLVKRNRELECKLEDARRTIEELNRSNDYFKARINELRAEKSIEAEVEISKECDMDLKRGDRVVITWVHKDCKSQAVGMVYEVATLFKKLLSDRTGISYFSLGVKTFDADGNAREGTGSVLSIKSKNAHWRKVPNDTPLSTRIKIIDKKNEYNDAYHYEFKNLYQTEELK